MRDIDFPALYRSADSLSAGSQKHFFMALKVHLISLILAAILSTVEFTHWSIALLQLLILLSALACSVYLFAIRPDRLWYAGRAVAESIKTVAWRYVCRAEPFDGSDSKARRDFGRKLKEIVDQNKDVGIALKDYLDESQITPLMDQMRALSLAERKESYSINRISNQLTWYSNKAKFNRKLSNAFFFALIAINSVAVIYAALRIAHPAISDWLTELLVTIAASLLSWMQAKRYSELAASYSLAANEIGLIREQVSLQYSDDEFSQFVGDSENAFSREHTQWTARRDA